MTWRRHFFYRQESLRSTWKLRFGVLIALAITLMLTHDFWVGLIGRSLVCARDTVPSDVILVENFDPDYLLFERARELELGGLARRVIVPVEASRDPSLILNLISKGVAEVMVRQARIEAVEMIPFREAEPISLNAALQIRDRLVQDHVRSVIVVASGLRSRRSALIYRTVLGKAGIRVRCEPVIGTRPPERWTETWHGIQGVLEEFVKLQYYRFYVIPFLAGAERVADEQRPR